MRATSSRRVAVAAAILVFLTLSVVVARWLAADGSERAAHHARRTAERLDQQEASVERFLEISGDDQA